MYVCVQYNNSSKNVFQSTFFTKPNKNQVNQTSSGKWSNQSHSSKKSNCFYTYLILTQNLAHSIRKFRKQFTQQKNLANLAYLIKNSEKNLLNCKI